MTRYLVPAFFKDVEGPTDWRFLEPLCRRLLADVLVDADEPVEVQARFLEVGDGRRDNQSLIEDAANLGGAAQVLFLHADGKGDPDRAYRERIAPIAAAVDQVGDCRLVGLVPVHETEAWMLADAAALADALGVTTALDVPRSPGEIEALARPKERLLAICERSAGGRRRRRRREPPRELLGQLVALQALRRLGAFRAFEERLRLALQELGYLPR